jgi:hypothetical protein
MLIKTFSKLLGKGRAWIHPSEFMQDFYEVLISPLKDVFDYIRNLQYIHFQSFYTNIENILNDEKLFGIKRVASTLTERANNIEIEWQMLSGNLNYKTLEDALLKAGFKIKIIENCDIADIDLGEGVSYGNSMYGGVVDGKQTQYGAHATKVISNGFLDICGINYDPVQLVNGKNLFYIKGYFNPNENEWDYITELVLKLKAMHTVAICEIAERVIVDNRFYNTTEFDDGIDGGTPFTTDWFEWLNKGSSI